MHEIPGAALRDEAAGAVRVTGVHHDSRRVEPGDLFVARAGARAAGASFIADAAARGAAAVLVERGSDAAAHGLPRVEATDVPRALAFAAAAVYGHPTFAVEVVGITGTNGKTTTAHLTQAAIDASGGRAGIVGTLGYRFADLDLPPTHTSPEADDLARLAAAMRARGASHLVMEVSSIALVARRADAVRFRVAAFTNLTQDHLDYHGTMEAYAAAKARLFVDLAPGAAAVNVDDPFGRELARRIAREAPLCRFSAEVGVGPEVAEIAPTALAVTQAGIALTARTPVGPASIRSPLLGAHNVSNLLTALSIAYLLDEDVRVAARALSADIKVPGRLERCDTPAADDVVVLVDYAHTPDALARVLASVQAPGRRADPLRLRLRRRPRSRQAPAHGRGGGPARGRRLRHQRQPPQRGSPGDRGRRPPRRRGRRSRAGGRRARSAPRHRAGRARGGARRRGAHRRQGARALPDPRRGHRAVRRSRRGAPGARAAARERGLLMATPIPPNEAAFTLAELLAATRGERIVPGADARDVDLHRHARRRPGRLLRRAARRGPRRARPPGRRRRARGPRSPSSIATSRRRPGSRSCASPTRWSPSETWRARTRAAGAAARATGRMVAITGSAGKTTTRIAVTALLEACLPEPRAIHSARGNLNNRVGVPMVLFGLGPAHGVAVIEMGMNQPGEIAELCRIAEPDVGVVTLIAAAHTEGLGSIEAVAEEKGALFRALPEGGVAIGNGDDPRVRGSPRALAGARAPPLRSRAGRAPAASSRASALGMRAVARRGVAARRFHHALARRGGCARVRGGCRRRRARLRRARER